MITDKGVTCPTVPVPCFNPSRDDHGRRTAPSATRPPSSFNPSRDDHGRERLPTGRMDQDGVSIPPGMITDATVRSSIRPSVTRFNPSRDDHGPPPGRRALPGARVSIPPGMITDSSRAARPSRAGCVSIPPGMITDSSRAARPSRAGCVSIPPGMITDETRLCRRWRASRFNPSRDDHGPGCICRTSTSRGTVSIPPGMITDRYTQTGRLLPGAVFQSLQG